MKEYNKPFFSLYENVFLELKERLGQDGAIEVFKSLMKKGLSASYGDDYQKGKTEEFARLVGERDELVGLEVKFPVVEEDKLVYQFHTDPFPGLKGKVDSKDLDETYMNFKVKYILGDDWKFKTTKHLWEGAPFTEHEIYREVAA